MGNAVNRLSARKAQTVSEPGRHADGNGLYLVVDQSGAKRWVVLYRIGGKRREMGLGSSSAVSLARARELAAAARAKIAEGIDPLTEKHAPKVVAQKPVTFADVATTYMSDHEKSWRNAKHRLQWQQTLEVQSSAIWLAPVAAISTEDVLAILRPIWHQKPETASRIRGRIEKVLDAARAAGHRTIDNPARWRGHLDALLPRPAKLSRGHHRAMPYEDLPAFYRDLTERSAISALALRFIILTAARSGEVRGMIWPEINTTTAVWTIPADRMKAGRAHRVPLNPEALSILEAIKPDEARAGDLVFPSSTGRKLSDMAFAMLLRRAKEDNITTHGFRSAFRDWVGNETEFAENLAEAALAHLVGDETERAYRRGDALNKRRQLMEAWAIFVAGDSPR